MPQRGNAPLPPAGGGRPPQRALLDFLGLAARARALVSGIDAARRGVRDGDVRVVFVASDASPVQAAKLLPLAEARRVPVFTCLTQEEMGLAIGRDVASAIAITNPSFASRAADLAAALASPQD